MLAIEAVQTATPLELVVYLILLGLGMGLAAIALRPLWLPLWRLFRGTQQFLEDWSGTPERPGRQAVPGAMARLGQLERNGGSTLSDTVHRIEERLEEVVVRVENVRDEARQATTAAGIAVNEARSGSRAVTAATERATAERHELSTRIDHLADELEERQAVRTAEAFELLAEHGGPDLRGHTLGEVKPHAHQVPTVQTPSVTGLPIDVDASETDGAATP